MMYHVKHVKISLANALSDAKAVHPDLHLSLADLKRIVQYHVDLVNGHIPHDAKVRIFTGLNITLNISMFQIGDLPQSRSRQPAQSAPHYSGAYAESSAIAASSKMALTNTFQAEPSGSIHSADVGGHSSRYRPAVQSSGHQVEESADSVKLNVWNNSFISFVIFYDDFFTMRFCS